VTAPTRSPARLPGHLHGKSPARRRRFACLAAYAVAGLTASACSDTGGPVIEEACIAPLASLADFPVGVAVPAGAAANSLLDSPDRQAIVRRHFDSVTAENIMKMAYLHPAPNRYTFDDADLLVAWAEANDLVVHGHALVWHRQAPEWMTTFEGDADALSAELDEHIRTVAGRYAGRLRSWDVVNEAFTDESPSTYRDTIWYRKLGPGYLEQAFRAARAADPAAELYYNDYGISGRDGAHKLARVLAMADDFRVRGVPLDGIGFQMHIDHDRPDAAALREAFGQVVSRGLKVRISELDIAVNASEDNSRITPELVDLQRKKFAEVARVYQEAVPSELRGGLTVWGITDGDSWIPGFRDRPDWPLLFNADFTAKPALAGLAEGLAAGADSDP
jgi:endo-1,4-beta-xylanase